MTRHLLPLTLCGVLLWTGGCGRRVDPPVLEPSVVEPTPEERAQLERLAELQAAQSHDQAIAEAEAFLTEHPGARRIHHAIGILQGLADRHLLALEAFERELARDPGHVSSYRGAATAQIVLGRPDAAIELLRQARRIEPNQPEVLLVLGRTLSNSGHLDEAMPVLTQAVERGAVGARVELGILRRRLGQLDQAASAFQDALREDPHDLGAMVNLGQTLMSLGRTGEGQALLRRHAELATLQDRLDIYRRSSRLEGATLGNFLYLGDLHVRSGNHAEAAEAYRRALELDPRSTRATLGLAALFLHDGQAQEATRWAVHTVLLDPKNSKAYLLLGLMRISNRQVAEARAAFERSQKIRPWRAEELWLVGDAWLDARQLDLAADYYERAITQKPTAARGHRGLGLSRWLRGEHAAALGSLRRAAELDSTDAESRLLLALLLSQEGHRDTAHVAFHDAAALHRLDLLTGRSVDQLVAPYASIPGAEPGLAIYRELLAE